MKFGILLSILLLSCAQLFAQARSEIRTAVYPQMPNVGQSSQFIVHFINMDGTDSMQIEPPVVEGLQFNPTPFRQQSTQMVNFQTTREVRLAWNFVPRREGVFQIPAREVMLGNQRVTLPAVSFRVAPQDQTIKEAFFLKLELPDRPLFPGERLSVPLHLYARTDFPTRLQSLPTRAGEAFLQEDLNQQFQSSRVSRNGMEYNRATWMLVLTPMRPGQHDLSFSMSILYENPRAPRSRDVFGMPQGRAEELLLSTPEYSVEVAEFPRSGRPEHFRGAVGNFEITSHVDSTRLEVGEPVTLHVTISGQGNLEAIAAPNLLNTENWRVYPPRIRTERSDPALPTGQRIFEIILMPESDTVQHMPIVPFAFFNPESRTWQERSTGGEPVTVQAPARTDGPVVWDFTQGDARGNRQTAQLRALRAPMPDPGIWLSWQQVERRQQVATLLIPPVSGTLLLGFVALGLWLRQRKLEDAIRTRRELAKRQWLQALDAAQKAEQSENGSAYWRSIRTALQIVCAQLQPNTDAPTTSLTSAEMLSRLQAARVAEELQAELKQWNSACEQAEYSGSQAAKPQPPFTITEARTFTQKLIELP